jgi:hypothetical protein
VKEDLALVIRHGCVSEIADAEPGQHHVTRLLDEHHRFGLELVNQGREIRFVWKWSVWGVSPCFSPMAVPGVGVVLQPEERVRGFHLKKSE